MRQAAGAAKGGVAFLNLEPRFGVHPVHGAVDGAIDEVHALVASGVERVVVRRPRNPLDPAMCVQVANRFSSSAGGEQRSVATPQAARGRARPPCRHINIKSCCGVCFRFERAAFQTLSGSTRNFVASLYGRWG